MTATIPTSAALIVPPRHRVRRAAWYSLIGAVWIGAAILGWASLFQHTYQPATTAADPVTQWPDASLPASSDRYQIVIFAHPCCPCTRATLNKFDESLTRLPSNTSIQVIFTTVGLIPSAVAESPTVAFARQLKGVDVQFDETGDIARRFHATVSGEVFAFDRQGRRLFHGGVTAGRGHQGDSVGQQQLERLVCGESREAYSAPVFGCTLAIGGDCRAERLSNSIDRGWRSLSADVP